MPNKWRYYEGTTSANSILRDLAKVLCTAVKSDPVLAADGVTVAKSAEIILENNWDIVYPPENKEAVILAIEGGVGNWTDLTPAEFAAKIDNQLSMVGKLGDTNGETIILKTKTTPVSISTTGTGMDDIGLEDDLSIRSIDMYVELYKPRYMADPEKYHPESERFGIRPYNITKELFREYNSPTKDIVIDLIDKYGNLAGGGTTTGNFFTAKETATALPSKKVIGTATEISTWLSGGLTGDKKSSLDLVNKLKDPAINIVATGNYSGIEGIRYAGKGYGITIVDGALVKNLDAEATELLRALTTAARGAKSLEECSTVAVWLYGGGSNADNASGWVVEIILSWKKINYGITKYLPAVGSTPESGFKLALDDYENIIASSIVFVAGNAGTPLKSGTDYNYDPVQGTITYVNNTPIAVAEVNLVNRPILTYTKNQEVGEIEAKKILYNNHCVHVRMFDKLFVDTDPNTGFDIINGRKIPYMGGPIPNDIDENTGEVIAINSHVSEWSKLSWYQDYEEVMRDELDGDVGTADLSQGMIFLPIETPGLNGDTRIRFWVNTNNDRVSAMFMGNPSLDFSTNRHLTSMMYLGRIESFENSINDTAGNFAMFTSSATVPCSTTPVKKRVTRPASAQIGVGNNSVVSANIKLPRGQYFERSITPVAKIIGESSELVMEAGDYVLDWATANNEVTITTVNAVTGNVFFNYSYYEDKVENVEGITRDSFGNILEIRYPENWGRNTATGVTDVAMLHTRSKAYFQKHHFMFTTTEEYMTKEMYGKSAYTGEYYADKVKITHGNDGPRGMLQDILVIDQSSLVSLDELIVNREFSKDLAKPEETYVFFPVNAAFSPFSGSPNALYGVAMKKGVKLPAPKDDAEAVQRAVDNLYIGKTTSLQNDLILPTEYADGVTITWTSSDEDILVVEDPA